ncbi:ABC transporter B family member 4, putative [Plasmodium berghei]|uniref:ABC transporter B family member 4, putative n=2 Tax=Plasmodium berghei TaxID=5821 RepID=A0A509AF71_PLABA|nr:ABC transporter B family member 4, putative [Plasmodium berghei ANKA]CXH98885.1 ABC transporter B family member 4, putative [Plasmodium berghei]SCL91443.1 ABC transporter B family member 4, putative [Plasmodium berghei]SCM15471.1 ABC transporter B family member 4, putative [Plasmodium berghei]SCM17263.1 ABC transporter B family member 4, putative [Plasmodium berghei]SCN22413.1 ABC transporter B family member 4, putative [Plasmodium berghei]|eukprot:XP_034420069.1 ABC transporter B family member 4, putative [Plasmodium berghei ANKA]
MKLLGYQFVRLLLFYILLYQNYNVINALNKNRHDIIHSGIHQNIYCSIKWHNKNTSEKVNKTNNRHTLNFLIPQNCLQKRDHNNSANRIISKFMKNANQKKIFNWGNNNNIYLSPFSSKNIKSHTKLYNQKNSLSDVYSKIIEKNKFKNSLLNDMTKLFKIIKKSKYIFCLGFLLTIISSVMDSYIPIFLSKAISHIMSKSGEIIGKINDTPFKSVFLFSNHKINKPLCEYILVSIFSLLFSSFKSYTFNLCAYISTNKLQNHLFRVLLHKNINYFKKKGTGALLSRLNIDSSELIDIFTTNIIVLLRNVIKMLLSFYFLYKINVKLVFIPLCIVFCIYNISILFSRIFRAIAKEESNNLAQSNNIIEQAINNFSLINTYNTHNEEINTFNNSINDICNTRLKLGFFYILEKFIIRTIDIITFVSTLIVIKQIIQNNNTHNDIRQIISSVIYIQKIISQSSTIEQQYSRVQELIGNAEDVIKLIEKDTFQDNQNKSIYFKNSYINFFNFTNLKNFIFNYSILKKMKAIQKNTNYVTNIIKPNYIKLFERNYNNLSKYIMDDKAELEGIQPNKEVIHEPFQIINKTGYTGNNTNKDNGIIPENSTNKIKKNKFDINIQEIHSFIKNDHELIIKYKLDKKFTNFLKTKYKKNIISLIVKLYEKRNHFVSDEYLFMFDNISKFSQLKNADKKSILKMSNITNNTIFITLLTFLFYNYSKFYYKKQKKKPINLLEKKKIKNTSTTHDTINNNNTSILLDEYNNNTSNENIVESDSSNTEDINLDDVINDPIICDLNIHGTSSETNGYCINNKCHISDISYNREIDKDITLNSNEINKQNNLYQAKQVDQTDNRSISSQCGISINEENLIKLKTKKKLKKKNFNNILSYIMQNAIKEIEILRYIDENYKNINEKLMINNINGDNKKGSSLTFKNVDFYIEKYPKNKILSNINLHFNNMYTYGILSYNNSGKNALTKLCSKLYTKTYGNILIDNENIENVSKYILTKKMSIVEEDTYLFSDSIIYNILYSYNFKEKKNNINNNLAYSYYNIELDKNNIKNCLHLFQSDNDILLNKDKIKINETTTNQNIVTHMSDQIIQDNLLLEKVNIKTCLMCGDQINTALFDHKNKKIKKINIYKKYKTHFITKLYKEIIKVSKIVCLDSLINSYKNKYFHNINSHNLSGGQKQKISLARAIIKNPKILILNEAFSALDSTNELNIFANIKKYLPNSTIINISHKITTIKHCDYIYVLKNGKIIEQGLRTKLQEDKNSEYSKKLNEF